MEETSRLQKSSMILHRVLAGDVADQHRRWADAEFSAHRFARGCIRTEEVEIISVRDHLYPIVCVPKLLVEGSRRFRNANNPPRQVARQCGARLRGPDRMALVDARMQLAVTDV